MPLRQIADEVVCAEEPARLYAVGPSYERFDQESDAQVLQLLAQGSARAGVST